VHAHYSFPFPRRHTHQNFTREIRWHPHTHIFSLQTHAQFLVALSLLPLVSRTRSNPNIGNALVRGAARRIRFLLPSKFGIINNLSLSLSLLACCSIAPAHRRYRRARVHTQHKMRAAMGWKNYRKKGKSKKCAHESAHYATHAALVTFTSPRLKPPRQTRDRTYHTSGTREARCCAAERRCSKGWRNIPIQRERSCFVCV
jgi:hypothetical protein